MTDEIDEGWQAFCRAENYDTSNVTMRVAYGCGFQDGAHIGWERLRKVLAYYLDGYQIESIRRDLVVTEEPDWEYGIQAEYSCGNDGVRMWGNNRDRIESQMYRWPGSTLVRRVVAGPWTPVQQEGTEE